jgi:hypothetical protein
LKISSKTVTSHSANYGTPFRKFDAQAHCAIAGTEIQDLKWRLNFKQNRPQKRRKINVDARWLNSDEGLTLAEEQEALQIAEEQKKREARE